VIDIGQLRTIRTNGKPDAGVELDEKLPVTEDEPTMALLAALPLAVKPDARLAANIGFGSGITTNNLLASPRIERVDTIEIEPAMVEAAKSFQPRNARAYSDPRSHIRIEDAKTFFAAQGTRYDVIVSEPSNPWVSGVSTLFSEEFYGQMRRHLATDGVLVQWIHAYELDFNLLASIFKALGKHFPDYAVYAWSPGDLYVVASAGPKLPALDGALFGYPLVAADLKRLGIESLADLQAMRVGGRAVLAPLFESGSTPANSDYFPVLDQRAPRSRFRGDHVFELREMRDALDPALAMLDGESRTPIERLGRGGRTQPPHVLRATAAREAIAIVEGRLDPGSPHALSPSNRAHALTVRALAPDCAGLQGLWVASLKDVVHATSPNLQASEVEPVFRFARSSACWKALDETARRRVALLEAVNARNAAGMLENARALLEASVPDDRGHYFVSAVTAALALGDRAEANRLVHRYFASLTARERTSLLVRFVVSQAT
jgi:SAM-dependent methyltransferase